MNFEVDNSKSFLTRTESLSLKGLLILLIVLGHNSIITGYTGIFPYLYSFHVYCFYLLPFVYGFQKKTESQNIADVLISRTWKNVRKLGGLYLLWCAIGCCYCLLSKHVSFQILPFLHAVLWGNQPLLAENCSFAFLWFLPTVVAVMFWRDVFFLLPVWGKSVLFLAGVLLWTAAVAGFGSFHSIGLWCPFALIQGLYFSAAGIAVRFLLQYIEKCPFSKHWFVLLFPVAPAYVWFRQYLPYGYNFLTWSVCPVFAFLGLYAVKDVLAKIHVFQIAGKYSLQIYLLHTMIFNMLMRIVKSNSLLIGLLIYALTLAFCGIGIFCAERLKFIRWMLFPLSKNINP